MIAAGTAFESRAAPKATKSSSKKKSASVIGKFTDGYSTYSLLSNGKLQISIKDRSIKIKGNYKKVNGGEYYKLFDHCASGCDGDASHINEDDIPQI